MEHNGNGNSSKGFLTAEDIFAAPLKIEIVEAFGGKIMVQELMEERANAIAEAEGDNVERGMQLIVACVVHPETRQPLFTVENIKQLKQKSNAEVVKLVRAVNRVNGFVPAEDIAKNSEASPADVSVIASPLISE